MPKEKRNKNKVPKITEEEYVRYVASLKEEAPLSIYRENVGGEKTKAEKDEKSS